jgi:hypothetical protein
VSHRSIPHAQKWGASLNGALRERLDQWKPEGLELLADLVDTCLVVRTGGFFFLLLTDALGTCGHYIITCLLVGDARRIGCVSIRCARQRQL